MTEIDHEYTDDPVCPFCGTAQRDVWEIEGIYTEEETRIECEECGQAYASFCSVSYSFTTHKVDLEAERAERQREVEEHLRWKEERKNACARFIPGTQVRVLKPKHLAGRIGVVANRELSTSVRVELPPDPGERRTRPWELSFMPGDLEAVS